MSDHMPPVVRELGEKGPKEHRLLSQEEATARVTAAVNKANESSKLGLSESTRQQLIKDIVEVCTKKGSSAAKLSLTGEDAGDYATLNKQVAAFRNAFVKAFTNKDPDASTYMPIGQIETNKEEAGLKVSLLFRSIFENVTLEKGKDMSAAIPKKTERFA